MELTDEKHLRSMTFLVTLGGIFLLGGTEEAGADTYLSALLTLPAVLVMGLLYARLTRLGGAGGYFGLCRRTLGGVGGRAAVAVTGLYALLVGGEVLGNLAYFIHTVMLPAVPEALIAAAAASVAAFAFLTGDRAMRWSAPLFTRTILGMLAFTVILSLLSVNYGNFPLPMFSDGIRPVLNGSRTVFSMSFGDAVLLLPFVRSDPETKLRVSGFLRGGVPTVLLLALIFLRNILALGSETASQLFFRSFVAVRVVSFGAFFQRLEIFVSMAYLLCDLFELTVCVRSAVSAVGAVCRRPIRKAAVFPALLVILAVALLLSGNEQGILSMLRVDRLAVPFVAVLLPATVWIIAEFQEKRSGSPKPETTD